MAQGSARGQSKTRAWIVAAVAAAGFMVAPTAVQAAGPTAIAVDDAGTSYVGYASGAVTRVSAVGGQLARWTTPVANANGSLGGVMAIDVAPSASNPNAGNVWILDSNRRVQEFTREGAFVRGFRLDECDGSNSPEPGREGGLYLTTAQIYVAHPCGDRIMRYPIASLPAAGMANVSPASTNSSVFAPHGIGGSDSSAPAPEYDFLYVAQPKDESVRWFDPLTLGNPPAGNPIPALSKTGETEDVFILNGGSQPRIYFADSANDDTANRHRFFAAEATFGDPPFGEIFNFGGLGTAPGEFDNPVAFDVFATIAPASTHVLVADRGNERIQRVTAQGNDNGNVVWTASATDPGPPPASPDPPPPTGGGDGGGAPLPAGGGSAGAGGTTGVLIDDDARYTNSLYVELTVREPAGTTAVEISNAPSFADKDTRAVRTSLDYDWTLDATGSDLVPRTVYVRFPGSSGDRVYSDEIILDRKPPLVGAATLSSKRRSRGHGKRRWFLKVAAEDEVSGIDQLQFSDTAGGEYKSWDYEERVRVRHRNRFRFVRLTDVAGNVSQSVPVRRGR